MLYDLAILGLGPAGQKLALLAHEKGQKVIVFEQNLPGGTCLNLGCIPTKSILHDSHKKVSWGEMIDRKSSITKRFNRAIEKDFKDKGIEIIYGVAKINPEKSLVVCNNEEYKAKNIVIATGSSPFELSNLPFDKDFILSSDDLFDLTELPKSIVIVGSGAIGIEWARIFNSLGVEVTIVEKAQSLLPTFDIDISKRTERIFKINKIKFYVDTTVSKAQKGKITLSNDEIINAEKVLVAVGRKKILPKSLGGEIILNQDFSTNFKNIWAIGDVTKYPMLAHCASYQAKCLAGELFENAKCNFDTNLIPSIIYGDIETASVGVKEQDIADEKDIEIHNLPIAFLPKAWCDDCIEGFIKIITKKDKIIGAHIISKEASSLLTAILVAMKAKMSVTQLKEIIYPHPTYAEGILEALER